MRQIGTLPGEVDPTPFTDFLLSLGITSRVLGETAGSSVWVHDEDKVGRAAEEFRTYLADPTNDRYRGARKVADEARKERERLERDYRKRFRSMSGHWDRSDLRGRPLTVALVGVCVALFVLENVSPAFDAWAFANLGFMVPSDFGPIKGPGQGLRAILRGQVWRLFTPALLHGGLLHLAFNAWAVMVLGTLIERRKGTRFLAVAVVLSAAFSNLVQYLYMLNFEQRLSPFVGISGVLYALFGYIWMKGTNEPEEGMILHPSSVRIMLLWLLIGFLGLMPIANGAHVGGLIFGVLLGLARF